ICNEPLGLEFRNEPFGPNRKRETRRRAAMARKKTKAPAQVPGKTKPGRRPHPEKESAESAPAGPPAEKGDRPLPVVGIGASAGGLDAFKKFFGAMPGDSGIA